jgi:two-component system sensor kinase FixL
MLHAKISELEAEINKRQLLEREILENSEREQCRFGQNLHEGLGQQLAGLALVGEVLAKRLQADSHPSSQLAADLASQTRETMDSARLLAKNLYPVEIDRFGLLLALEDLAHLTVQRFGIACELVKIGKPPQFEKTAEIQVYRIVQEGIEKAIKHSKARRIIIESLAAEDGHIFAIIDDGIGIEDPTHHLAKALHRLQHRARVIGGKITEERPKNGGRRIICRIPQKITGSPKANAKVGTKRGKIRKKPVCV